MNAERRLILSRIFTNCNLQLSFFLKTFQFVDLSITHDVKWEST